MKKISPLLFLLFSFSCATGKEKTYTGSTPAGPVVRLFLGIPLSDSVDFIRWNLTLANDRYTLHCNYGVAKQNTRGFINGGNILDLAGVLKKENFGYQLQNGSSSLKLAELNEDLLHFLDSENSLLAGTGGWSYTISNTHPRVTDQLKFPSKPAVLTDSLVFHGRTLCGVPGIVPPGASCTILKWHLVLYADAGKNQPTSFRVLGTAWKKEGPKTGTWKIVEGKDGRIIYQLNDENNKPFLNLLSPGGDILLFTDSNGRLLVGNEDFSYTLSRKR